MDMDSDGTLQVFKAIIGGIYDMMCSAKFHVFDTDITLWGIFLWGLIGGFAVWFIRKLIDD